MKYPKIKLNFSLLVLILVNLLIFFQAIYSNLDVVSILLVYWTESVIIGFFIVIGMLFSRAEKDYSQGIRARLIGIPFFILHYSLFLFVHFIFIMVLGNNFAQNINLASYLTSLKSVFIYSLFLFVSHLISFISNFIILKENEKFDVWSLMLLPYRRIILMQITLILGALAVILSGNPQSIIFLLFFPLKIIFDVYGYVKEHRE